MAKETIEYYDRNADWYYWTTVGVDMDAMRKKFASHLPNEARVLDMGCGSGRDVLAFSYMGHDAAGLDASKELLKLAKERLEIKTIYGDMARWRAGEPYDGIWCCASLIHLNNAEIKSFFNNLDYNLKPGGIIYISVMDGIETGIDKDGRYYNDCSEEELRKYLDEAGCEIVETLITEDALGRDRFKWLNVFARKNRNN